MNIDEFTRVVIGCVLHHNNAHIIKDYPRDLDMLADGVKPIPVELWEWGVQRRNGRSLQYPHEQVKLSLLPTDEATITASGIDFYGCFYSCNEALSSHWFERARQRGVWKVRISYDPRCMDAIYLHGQGKFIKCDLTDRSLVFRSMSLWEIDEIRESEREMNANHAPKEMASKIDLKRHVESVVKEARAAKGRQTSSPMSKRAKTANIQANRAEEKKALRKRDAFVRDSRGHEFGISKENGVSEPDVDEYRLPEITPNILNFSRKSK